MDANINTPTYNITGIWKVCHSDCLFQIDISQLPGTNLYQGKLINYDKQVIEVDNTLKTGLDILKIKFNPDKNYGKGKLLDISSGKIYRCILTLVMPDTLQIIKHLRSGFIRHIELWQRINNQ
jgi:uncharacterized protein (DUF2147 family)